MNNSPNELLKVRQNKCNSTHVQGGKVLLTAESRAFFTVYRTITDSGLRAYQLDRDSQHDAMTSPNEVLHRYLLNWGVFQLLYRRRVLELPIAFASLVLRPTSAANV